MSCDTIVCSFYMSCDTIVCSFMCHVILLFVIASVLILNTVCLYFYVSCATIVCNIICINIKYCVTVCL